MNFTKEDLEKKSDLELATIARKHGVWNYFLRKTLVLDIIIPTLSSAKTVYDLGIALKELEEKLENFVREHGLSELDEVHYDQKTNQIQIFLLSLPETNIEREFLINSLLKTNEQKSVDLESPLGFYSCMGNLPIAQNTPLFDKNRYSMVVGVTGHRTIDHPQKEIEEKLVKILEDKKPALVITGMALGFDLLVAELCFKQNIPYLAALPFRKQDALWNEESRKSYLFLLEKASEVVLVNDREYVSNSDYHKRDRWIVDNSHKMICYRKPKQQSGGTVYTCKYAGIKNVEIIANVYTK